MIAKLYEWLTPIRPRFDDGDSTEVAALWELYPSVKLPEYTVVGPQKQGLYSLWTWGLKFVYRGRPMGCAWQMSDPDIFFSPAFQMALLFRRILADEEAQARTEVQNYAF